MTLFTADRDRFPISEWEIIETRFRPGNEGPLETIFAIGNGHLGVRGAHAFGGPVHSRGAFINGLYETEPILHAEDAFGFARVGQHICDLPGVELTEIRVDSVTLTLESVEVRSYSRSINMKTGIYECRISWVLPSGTLATTVERRAVGHNSRSVFAQELVITTDRPATVHVSSALGALEQMIGTEDAPVFIPADADTPDPRRAGRRVAPSLRFETEVGPAHRLRSAWRTVNSGQQLGLAVDLDVTGASHELLWSRRDRIAETTLELAGNSPVTISKVAAYVHHSGLSAQEILMHAETAIEPAAQIFAERAAYFAEFWVHADVELLGDPGIQQAVRWNIFQIAQASAEVKANGIPAKGVSGSGYDGHYFWDQEIYLQPFLTYVTPHVAKQVLLSRYDLLPAARRRAAELSVDGALFPWRTINGEESSAYFPAGTAQFHIDSAVAFSLERYRWARGDDEFTRTAGAEILLETARMWLSLGFFGEDGHFHIDGVTGPDEYTAIVNDNLYTNVMARMNLRAAAQLPEGCVEDAERRSFRVAADAMALPYDSRLEIYAQDRDFTSLRPWDWSTPREKYPLLLHFHPLVIYRHRVIKQADAVLAMLLRWQDFTAEEKRRAFAYYDPITTGDSTLSACVQGIMAAEVGRPDAALEHFTQAVYIDLDNTHSNTVDGVHTASAGGIWSAIVQGFAGMRDQGEVLEFRPRMPASWQQISFRLHLRESVLRVTVRPGEFIVELLSGPEVDVSIEDELCHVGPAGVRIQLPELNIYDQTHTGTIRIA